MTEKSQMIVDAFGFNCGKCESKDLREPSILLTDWNRIYIRFKCLDCGITVDVEIDQAIAKLFGAQLQPGSKALN